MPESEGLENYVVNDLFDDALDTIVQGLCFEIHRAHKSGRLFLDEGPQVSSCHGRVGTTFHASYRKPEPQ